MGTCAWRAEGAQGKTVAVLGSFASVSRRLEELWLNDNPLRSLPVELSRCTRLRVLDVQNTLLTALPREISRLPSLMVLDLEGTDLRSDVQRVLRTGGPQALMRHLAEEDETLGLKDALHHTLTIDVYYEISDTEQGKSDIESLVEDLMAEFPNPTQLRTLIRNAVRGFWSPRAVGLDDRDAFSLQFWVTSS